MAAALCLAQAVALAVAINHGWYYNDDFALLMNASHRSLGWNYLKMPINDHLLPGERLEFWLLRHTAPLNFAVTIVVRLVLQAACSLLLIRLLMVLVGRRRRVLLIAGLYCLCPLVLTNTLWLTVALSLLPAQALMLGCLLLHLRYWASGRLRWAALSGLCLLASALFWEKAAVSALLLPILAIGYLGHGPARHRLLELVRQWRGWLLIVLPIGLFAAFFLSQGYGGATHPIAPADLGRVLWLQWSRVVAPSLFGGPWHWLDLPGVSLGYARLNTAGVVLVQLAVGCLVLLGLRLAGWKSLVGWLFPILPLLVGTTVVALGRFHNFGVLIATTLRYGADLAVPLFLGLALAMTPTRAGAIRMRACGIPTEPPPAGAPSETEHQPYLDEPSAAAGEPAMDAPSAEGQRQGSGRRRAVGRLAATRRPARLALLVAAIAWLIGAGLSVGRFDRHWAANPTHSYVHTLTASIAAAGPSLNLYDTTVSQSVLPIFFGPHWHLSDFLPLTGRVPQLDGPGTEPLVVDDSGRPVPAALVPAVTRGPPPGGLCSYLVQGTGTFTIPFDRPAPWGDGFLRIDYLQPRPSTARIWVVDDRGRRLPPVTGDRVLFGDLLSHVTLRLPLTSITAVVVRTESPETHLCMGRLTVGAPFPVHSGG